MYAALPQKYRPRTLSELAGQEYIQRTLANAIKANKIAPAYLFAGERGVGKTSTARIFAKSLNCNATDKPTVTPCGKCQSCRSIEKGNSLDVVEIDAASHNGVEDARTLIERAHFAPAMSRYRIFVLDECHQLTSQAQNALLKCIEEPPANVVFILCTTEAHKLLATISSRCQVFHFRVLAIHAIVQQLTMIADSESIAISDEAKVAIARIAEGGLRDALQLLDQLSLLGEEITSSHVLELSGRISESDLITILQSIRSGDTLKLLQLSRELIDSGKTAKVLLMSLLACYRDLLLVANVRDSSHLLTSGISHSTLLKIVADWDYRVINAGIEQLRASEWQLSKSVQPSLWLEVCLLGLVQGNDSSKSSQCSKEKQPVQLTAIWEKVLDKTSENNRVLLEVASLVELKGKKAVLAVPAKYLDRFNRNTAKVQKMLFGVTGVNYQLLIQEKG
ncbi:DNA polymerase III subunit gamma/tau [Floridanema aerugineum]|uniref:DNA polymerase III subunit gamma/tau n=1 Tax=Floridaenema aerugineum BLCC-F46 TaxID=3153654 RepID=A0ABV4XCZ8_9CYAN